MIKGTEQFVVNSEQKFTEAAVTKDEKERRRRKKKKEDEDEGAENRKQHAGYLPNIPRLKKVNHSGR